MSTPDPTQIPHTTPANGTVATGGTGPVDGHAPAHPATDDGHPHPTDTPPTPTTPTAPGVVTVPAVTTAPDHTRVPAAPTPTADSAAAPVSPSNTPDVAADAVSPADAAGSVTEEATPAPRTGTDTSTSTAHGTPDGHTAPAADTAPAVTAAPAAVVPDAAPAHTSVPASDDDPAVPDANTAPQDDTGAPAAVVPASPGDAPAATVPNNPAVAAPDAATTSAVDVVPDGTTAPAAAPTAAPAAPTAAPADADVAPAAADNADADADVAPAEPGAAPTAVPALLAQQCPAIIAILGDTEDFTTAQTLYPQLYAPYTDYPHYLAHIEHLLHTRAASGLHTLAICDDPGLYDRFCTDHHLDADTPTSHARFTWHTATHTNATVPYTGQPLDGFIHEVLHAALEHDTLEYARELLIDHASCPDCGNDLTRPALVHADDLLSVLLSQAPTGTSHLICAVATPEPLVAMLHADLAPDRDLGQPFIVTDVFDGCDPAQTALCTTVLAAGIITHAHGGITLRTRLADSSEQVRGWRLCNGRLHPLTAAEVFAAYCTDIDTGEPVPPEHGVDYQSGYPLTRPEWHTHD
ncbi:hypothetical protein ACFWBX_08950 [Streptomyces sp. NPDC059991]|uniref:hypothetical protein n=1 Tax=Streptomyces sp. NPDC059991 TaxID=3347028 RepID=UPI0036A3DE22